MSQENVELVRKLQPSPGIDLVALFRDAGVGIQAGEWGGLAGLRAAWADWLEPWASYRAEIEDVIDAGDDVVVLTRDYGRRPGMSAEIPIVAAAVWTVREGKIARNCFYPNREDALRAVGLPER
jgi:ketosteroid isomerase-like protein